MLKSRADVNAPNMGLQVRAKDEIRQADAIVAKNYLAPGEVTELNRLTTILLDIFEDQLAMGRLTTMTHATRMLDKQIHTLGRMVLSHGGQVRHDTAEAAAKSHYRRFDAERKAAMKADADAELAALRAADKALPRARKARIPKN